MSAVNVVINKAAVHVMTDGVVLCDEDGSLLRTMNKQLCLPHLRAVAAYRASNSQLAAMMIDQTVRAETFDELKASIGVRFGQFVDMVASAVEFSGMIVVAGWSESADAPEGYYVASASPRTVVPLGIYFAAPGSQAAIDHLSKGGEGFDPAVHGVRAMEAQRQMPGPQGAPFVGAFCVASTIERTGITTRVVKRWPDKIGERIK